MACMPGEAAELYSDAVHTQQCYCPCAHREGVMHAGAVQGTGNTAPSSLGKHPARSAGPGRAWIVNTMPTKPAVSSATPSERGPTSFSCSTVLRRWILPAQPAPPLKDSPSDSGAIARSAASGCSQAIQTITLSALWAARRQSHTRRQAAIQLPPWCRQSARAPLRCAACSQERDPVQAEAQTTAGRGTGKGMEHTPPRKMRVAHWPPSTTAAMDRHIHLAGLARLNQVDRTALAGPPSALV